MIDYARMKERKIAEGYFINPSEFIEGGPKKGPKMALIRQFSSAVVEGPYPGGMLPV